jgi:hypothetical protein
MEVQSISATTIRTSMSIPDAASIGECYRQRGLELEDRVSEPVNPTV